MGLDPMTAAISMITCGEDVISSQGLKVADIESIETEQLLSEVFYECKKDLMEKAAIETPTLDILDIKMPIMQNDEIQVQENNFLPDAPLPKSISSGCLNSMDCVQGAAVKPNFLEFSGVDLGTAYGMRRAYSEGDIKVRLKHFSLTLQFCYNSSSLIHLHISIIGFSSALFWFSPFIRVSLDGNMCRV